MGRRSSLAARPVVCLVAVLLLGLSLVGPVGAIDGIDSNSTEPDADVDDSTLLDPNDSTSDGENATDETAGLVGTTANEIGDLLGSTADGTVSTVEETADGTTDLVGNTTEDTVDTVETTTTETTDAVENTTEETTDTVERVGEGTTETVDGTIDEALVESSSLEETTDALSDSVEDTVGLAGETTEETTGLVENTTEETTGLVSGTTEETTDLAGETTPVSAATDDGIGETETADGDDETGASDESGEREAPSAAADAILVGMLGAITAGGATAGSAGASGAAGATGGAAAGWTSRFSLRYLRRLLPKLPLELLAILRYSRYDDSDPLENDVRQAVYETIRDDPGCYLSRVSDRSGVSVSTVRYHVRILEDEGMVTTAKVNGKRRYYLDATDVELRAALEEPAKRDVLETLAEIGRARNGRLADELDRDPSTVSHHLSALADDGLVVRERDGRAMVNELTPNAETALLGKTAPDATASRPAPADD